MSNASEPKPESEPARAQPQARHNAAVSRFEMALPGVAELAVLEYTLAPANAPGTPGAREGEGARVIFTHTYVPEAMRGKGVAEKLVRAGLAEARAHGWRVVAECSYVAKFIGRHVGEYGGLLAR